MCHEMKVLVSSRESHVKLIPELPPGLASRMFLGVSLTSMVTPKKTVCHVDGR